MLKRSRFNPKDKARSAAAIRPPAPYYFPAAALFEPAWVPIAPIRTADHQNRFAIAPRRNVETLAFQSAGQGAQRRSHPSTGTISS